MLLSRRIKPLLPFPALVIENSEKILVVADLHIGWERAWSESGIYVPSQADKLRKKLLSIVERHKPDRLILLGDIKQAITRVSMEEWQEIPKFFEALQEHLNEVIVIRGNHDGDLEPLTPSTIRIHPSSGMTIGSNPRIGLFHGHAWPSPEVLSSEILVKTNGDPQEAFRLKTGLHVGDSRLIILPAFNDLVGGVSINRLETRLLGPILRSRGVDVESAEVYLLDGTYLGKTGQLQKYLTDLAKS